MMRIIVVASIAFASGCHTEECKELEVLLDQKQRFAAMLQQRAEAVSRLEASAQKAHQSAKDVLTKFGLEQKPKEITKLLLERAKEFEGRVEQSERAKALKPTDQDTGETEPLFVVEFPAGSLAEAWGKTGLIATIPPLVRLVGLKPLASNRWRLEMSHLDVEQASVDIKPTPIEGPRSADEISRESGLCGASALRNKVEALEADIETLRPQAEQVSVLLPLAATWQGLSQRAMGAAEVEIESRRMIGLLIDAVIEAKVPFEQLGAERDVVILELSGRAEQRKAVLSKLPPRLLENLRTIQKQVDEPDLVRIALGNARAAKTKATRHKH